MDGITIFCILSSFRKRLPLRVRKVYQPSGREIHLVLAGRSGEVRLAISVDPRFPFIGPVTFHPAYPTYPPAFCQTLRARLEGLFLLSAVQAERDRYVRLEFGSAPAAGERAAPYRFLICDLRGTRADLVFADLRSGDVRSLSGKEPGDPAELAQGCGPGLTGSSQAGPGRELDPDAIFAEGAASWRVISRSLPGAGKDLCLSILAEYDRKTTGGRDDGRSENLRELVRATEERIAKELWEPAVYMELSGKPVFHVLPLSHLRRLESFADPEEACSRYYELMFSYLETESSRRHLASLLNFLRKKISSRLEAQERDYAQSASYEQFRLWGELLYASGKRLPPGYSSVRVTNYYEDPPRETEVPLDPSRSLQENAGTYLEKYKKLRRSREVLSSAIERSRRALATLHEIEALIDVAASPGEMAALEEELRVVARDHDIHVPDREDAPAPRSRNDLPGRPRISSFRIGEYTVFVGGTSRQNDYLVTRVARPGDLWFHARGVPGAHVLLRPPAGVTAGNVDPEVLLEAARIAARRSQARFALKADVDYTDAANLRKPPRSDPGFVTYTGEKTLVVRLED